MTVHDRSLSDYLKGLHGARPPKYRNRRTPYNGRVYDSAREAEYAWSLDLRKRAGEIKDWRPQVPIPLEISGQRICTYRVDFQVIFPDGCEELIEVKGYETEVWKLKRKLFRALYPDRQLRVIS